MRRLPALIVLAACSFAPWLDASAQTARSGGGGGANAQAVQQMQALAAERTQLQAENARLKKELEDLKKDRDAIKASQDAIDRRARAAQSELARGAREKDTTAQELEQTKSRLQELLAKSREIVDTLRTVEADRNTLQQKFEVADTGLKSCGDKNRELFKINTEVLDRLERRGGPKEPFTQIARARLENMIDDYRYRADEQRVPDAASPQGPNDAR